MSEASVPQRIYDALEPLLGRHTAKRALTLVCEKLNKEETSLTEDDLIPACQTLRPILRTLVGRDLAGRVIRDLGGPEDED